MKNQPGSLLFALIVGLAIAWYAYDRVTDPLPRQRRAEEERIVLLAREILKAEIAPGESIDIVDPLRPNRIAGKVFIYPTGQGWEVSGHYRRRDGEPWHPWLMRLGATGALLSLSVKDTDRALRRRAAGNPLLSVES